MTINIFTKYYLQSFPCNFPGCKHLCRGGGSRVTAWQRNKRWRVTLHLATSPSRDTATLVTLWHLHLPPRWSHPRAPPCRCPHPPGDWSHGAQSPHQFHDPEKRGGGRGLFSEELQLPTIVERVVTKYFHSWSPKVTKEHYEKHTTYRTIMASYLVYLVSSVW